MIRRTVQRVRQELLRAFRLRDHLVQLVKLLANDFSPLRAGSVEDRCGGVERDTQPVEDLDQRQPAKFLGPYIRRPARRSCGRTSPRSS